MFMTKPFEIIQIDSVAIYQCQVCIMNFLGLFFQTNEELQPIPHEWVINHLIYIIICCNISWYEHEIWNQAAFVHMCLNLKIISFTM